MKELSLVENAVLHGVSSRVVTDGQTEKHCEVKWLFLQLLFSKY